MMPSKFRLTKSLEDEVKKARFTEQQIIEILKLAESGTKVTDLCRKHGISQWTFYQWRNKYGGMGVSEAKRLKELEEENRRLKKIVADQALDVSALKEALHRKW
jgi:putative transposase